jgi:hexosaminidase
MKVLVKKYLADHDAQAADKLQTIFAHWAVAGPQAQAIMSSRPLLKNVEPRAEQLTTLGKMGVEALLYLSKKQTAPAGWAQSQLNLIDEAQKPVGLVRFTVLDPLRELVKAVGQQQ